MRDPNNPCLFCNSKESGITHENDLAYASYDTYPVSDHHCLIIPKRHVVDYFELSDDEIIACNNLIKIIKKEFLKSLVVIAEFKASGLLYISEYITPAALTCAVS